MGPDFHAHGRAADAWRIASDGSDDRTVEIARALKDKGIMVRGFAKVTTQVFRLKAED